MRILLRESTEPYGKRKPLTTPADAAESVREIMKEDNECFCVILLDAKNGLISSEVITVGVLDACLVHPREVFRTAIKNNASAIVVAHNHPSGTTVPSAADLALTKQIVESGKILDIRVLDHVIVAGSEILSLREEKICRFA